MVNTSSEPPMTDISDPVDDRIVAVEEGAEAFVELLNANNVDFIFLNPGTDTFPIQEALSKYKSLGKRTPKVVLSLHESMAMASAHGYFLLTKRPQVVLVHVDLGTQQVGGALHNAQRGKAGVVLCAGRAPWNTDSETRGTRSLSIHWIQEQFDQASIVRDYVKWDYELRSNKNIHQVMQRAFQVAAADPPGPVYLSLPREILMEKISSVHVPAQKKHGTPVTPAPDPSAISEAAKILAKAEKPLIIVGNPGRHPEAVAYLVKLAETLGTPVITSGMAMNFPTDHDLYNGLNLSPYFEEADAVLVIDYDIPYVPTKFKPKPNTKFIHMQIDPLRVGIPLWYFPADVLIEADSCKAIPELTKAVSSLLTASQHAKVEARSTQIKENRQRMRTKWQQLALDKKSQSPISLDWLSYCIGEAVGPEDIVIDEAVTSSPFIERHLTRTRPESLFRSGGSSLGFGLGGALGAKLAAPERTVITLVGDGAFVFGCPIAALWAAKTHQAPFLCIIFNNGLYKAAKQSLQEAYGENSCSERTCTWVGMDIAPSPDYATIARACGCYGEKVQHPEDIHGALKRALEEVRAGNPAVLDVVVEAQ